MRAEVYYITLENSEDQLDQANNLEEAIRLAREWAADRSIEEGPVNIEYQGLVIRQFTRRLDGTITEEEIPGPLAEHPAGD
jgi:hypothetical protein